MYIEDFTKTKLTFSLQVVIRPTASSSRQPEWYQMVTVKKNCPDDLRIKIAVRMDKPQNMKHCGLVIFLQMYKCSKSYNN